MVNKMIGTSGIDFFKCLAAFQDTLNNFTGIDMLVRVSANFPENTQFFWCGIRVICKWNKGCRAMVDCMGGPDREGFEV